MKLSLFPRQMLFVVAVFVAGETFACRAPSILHSGAGGVTCADKQTILDEHNRLRQLVALGQIRSQPGAENMIEMIWDDELAAVSQRWADSCVFYHDNNRNVGRFPVGQNLAQSWIKGPSGPYDTEPNWRRQIANWFNEVQHYRSGYSSATGHYTQMVWATSYRIGCGYSFFYDPFRGHVKNYVCNYGPSGNVLGYFPYHRGAPSCERHGLLHSNRYAGLCSPGPYYYLGNYC